MGGWYRCSAVVTNRFLAGMHAFPVGEHTHYVGSYEPLVPVEPVVVDAEDPVPPRNADEVEVWLTGWQMEEDGFDVVLGEQMDRELVPMDQQWLGHLFAGRRSIALQRDTCAGVP